MEAITSKENSRYKQLCKLVSSKKERQKTGLFVAEGLRLCCDAVRSGMIPESIFATEHFVKKFPDEWQQLTAQCARQYLITEELSEKISDTQTPQGVFAVFAALDKTVNTGKIEYGRFLFLVSLQDPGNVGTIIRTAEALGISGVLMTSDCPDVYSPKVLRSTMGSLFRLPIYNVENPIELVCDFQHKGFSVYAAALRNDSVKLGTVSFPEKAMVLIGNEANGLPQEVISACDKVLMIPMKGNAESLNAASAANIIMWEMMK